MNFICDDAHISRFIFNGKINTINSDAPPTVNIQLWRSNSSKQYFIEDSWSIYKNNVTERSDGLLQYDLQTAKSVTSRDVIGIFLPRQTPEVDIYYLRMSSSQFYFATASNPYSTISVNQMTIGDRTYPKITAELCKCICILII